MLGDLPGVFTGSIAGFGRQVSMARGSSIDVRAPAVSSPPHLQVSHIPTERSRSRYAAHSPECDRRPARLSARLPQNRNSRDRAPVGSARMVSARPGAPRFALAGSALGGSAVPPPCRGGLGNEPMRASFHNSVCTIPVNRYFGRVVTWRILTKKW
jgi:hypothetical protein